MAAVLAVGEDAALSHASAAYSYGLRKSPAERVEILVPHARRVRPPNGIRVQRCRGLAERIDEQAMPARTTVEHTVLDLAAEGTADEAVALAALACQRGLTWDERLLEVLEARRRHRWTPLLREALRDIGDGAQSTFESEVRQRCRTRAPPSKGPAPATDGQRPTTPRCRVRRGEGAHRARRPGLPLHSTRPDHRRTPRPQHGHGWSGDPAGLLAGRRRHSLRPDEGCRGAALQSGLGRCAESVSTRQLRHRVTCGETTPRPDVVRLPQSGARAALPPARRTAPKNRRTKGRRHLGLPAVGPAA